MVTLSGNVSWVSLVVFVAVWSVIALFGPLGVLAYARKQSTIGQTSAMVVASGFLAAAVVIVGQNLLQGPEGSILIWLDTQLDAFLNEDLSNGIFGSGNTPPTYPIVFLKRI